MLDKEPVFFFFFFLFGTREDVIEAMIKTQGVSAFSPSKGTGVSGAVGPHSLLTAGPRWL